MTTTTRESCLCRSVWRVENNGKKRKRCGKIMYMYMETSCGCGQCRRNE